MIKGVESLLHNSRFTSAQHVADNRTTADVRLHNSCCAADDTISFDNYSYPPRELGWDIDETINPVLFSQKEWEENRHTLFNHNVTREGIAI